MENVWMDSIVNRRQLLNYAGFFLLGGSSVLLTPATSIADSYRGRLKVFSRAGAFSPVSIVVTNFSGDVQLGLIISSILSEDLMLSGYFSSLGADLIPGVVIGAKVVPDFTYWKALNVQALVAASVFRDSDKIVGQLKVWDVFAGRLLHGQRFSTDSGNVRRLSHVLADQVYTVLTGHSGMFDSCLAYISESVGSSSRIKRLAVADWNGLNARYFTDGMEHVISPTFDATGERVAYTLLGEKGPEVFILDLSGKVRYPLGYSRGSAYAPSFSPDGGSVVFSRQVGGSAHICSMDFRTRKVRRLTSEIAIDTSPAFSPDGSLVAFESDRSGEQQLYVMRRDGSDQVRISFGSGKYATPVWSPDLSHPLIAFTKRRSDVYMIGVMRPDGSDERILAYGHHSERPTWSPNGRHIMFFSEELDSSGPRLIIVDIFGNARVKLDDAGYASDPFWSLLFD